MYEKKKRTLIQFLVYSYSV